MHVCMCSWSVVSVGTTFPRNSKVKFLLSYFVYILCYTFSHPCVIEVKVAK